MYINLNLTRIPGVTLLVNEHKHDARLNRRQPRSRGPLSLWRRKTQFAPRAELWLVNFNFSRVDRMPGVTLCWASRNGLASAPCDGLASHPEKTINAPWMLLATLCWVPCDDQHPNQGRVVILLVTLCWVPCDGLASHPGKSSNTPSHFMLGTLWWTSIPTRGE